jgi:hypothetical protein
VCMRACVCVCVCLEQMQAARGLIARVPRWGARAAAVWVLGAPAAPCRPVSVARCAPACLMQPRVCPCYCGGGPALSLPVLLRWRPRP